MLFVSNNKPVTVMTYDSSPLVFFFLENMNGKTAAAD